MYLNKIILSNFRCFQQAEIVLKDGLNLLVGENDSGKTAIMDAIRIVMGTTDQNWYRVEPSDFYNDDISSEIKIILKFSDLTDFEKAAFLECLSYDSDGQPCLFINWKCSFLMSFNPPRTKIDITTGVNGDGPMLPSEARELLRVTYLRPLRDSYSNMQAGRNSRLSQIIQGIQDVNNGESTYSEGMNLSELSISGIADLSNKLLREHNKLKETNDKLSNILNTKMLLHGDNITTQFSVAGDNLSDEKRLTSLLEKLDLSAHYTDQKGRVGLGTSNILSMACELLLNRQQGSSFLLIEEPEAHIHAQRQLRLIQSLQAEANSKQQIFITTHSPLLASVVNLENIIIVKAPNIYPLAKEFTKLEEVDYKFLERFLDSTKANLFFARAVIIVEGAAEELLLPTIAKLLDMDLAEYGITLVNVRGTGLSRYARIFQRKDEEKTLPIPVACITDRDIMPDCAAIICKGEEPDKKTWSKHRKWKVESDFDATTKEAHVQKIKEKADGQNVKTFVAGNWTLEYDLAFSGLADELIDAISLVYYNNDDKKKIRIPECETQEEKSAHIYSYFMNYQVSKAEVAQQLAVILENKYADNAEALKEKLPDYLKNALNYVTRRS